MESLQFALNMKAHRSETEKHMAESQIEWTDATWNPVVGCSIVSAGCTHCYAMGMARRLELMGMDKYAGLTRKTGDRFVWTGRARTDVNALEIPLTWRKPRKVFVNSMSDLFHEDIPTAFIHAVWDVMRRTPRHSYQILTKRPERMVDVVSKMDDAVLPNVWLGTSVENRVAVDRIGILATVPAAVRFISFEPLIGPIGNIDMSGIDWAIVGGESGRAARPISEEWIDEIHRQCASQGVAFFFKQWGAWGGDKRKRSKKANGRLYRGQTWDAMPISLQTPV